MSQRDTLAGVLERLKESPTNEDAWRSLYRQLRPFVIAVIYRRLTGGERKAVEDATQEVFIRLFRARPFDQIPDWDSLRAYVWKIADNVARTHLQRLRVEKGVERDLVEWRVLEPSAEALDSESSLQAREFFDLAESVLSPKDRDLFRLMLEGSTLGQAAEQLGLSYSNAGIRMHRIRRKLLNLFDLDNKKTRRRP